MPILLLAEGRTGSNLLCDLLNSIPDVRMLGEVLHPNSELGYPLRYRSNKAMRHMRRSQHYTGAKYGGVTVHLKHLFDRGITVAEVLDHVQDSIIILLYRESVLEQYVSWKLAKSSGKWVGSNNSAIHPPNTSLRVNIDDYLAYRTMITRRYNEALSQLQGCPRTILASYEEISTDPQGFFNEGIFPRLGVSPIDVTTKMRKQNQIPIRDRISNYSEIEPYAGMIHLERQSGV